MPLLTWCQSLEPSALATSMSESIWLFPLIEGSHILALPLSVGMIAFFELRLLGLQAGAAAVVSRSRLATDSTRWHDRTMTSPSSPEDMRGA